MLQVTRFAHDGQPFPRRTQYHKSATEIKRVYGLSGEEIAQALETGEPVRGHVVEFAPYFLEQMELDEEIENHGPFSAKEIAAVMDTHASIIRQVLSRARKKLLESAALKTVASSIRPSLPDDARYRVVKISTTLDIRY